ncbi:ly6/PLAUR domain-containing protein 2-like [Lissotriton helveticus]
MKVLCGTLLVAAMLFGLAYSALQCFTCGGSASPMNCLKKTKCNKDETYCKTEMTFSEEGLDVSKTCTSACAPSPVPGVVVMCCQKNLCNNVPPTGRKKAMT